MVTFMGQVTHPGCKQQESEKLAQEFVAAIQRGDEQEANRLEALVNKADAPAHLGKSALWYAKRGWPVFPLLAGRKEPAVKNGLHAATTDLNKIKEWWGMHSDSNIGLATGHYFDVIDIDGPTGIQSLAETPEGTFPDIHGKVGTPRGFHLYIQPTGSGNRAGVRPGIDYRGKGGYVVAPPSRIDLRHYKWIIKPSPEIQHAS